MEEREKREKINTRIVINHLIKQPFPQTTIQTK